MLLFSLQAHKEALWKDLGIEVLRLCQYWCYYSPCELVFGMIKKLLAWTMRINSTNLSKDSSKAELFKAREKLNMQKAQNMCTCNQNLQKRLIRLHGKTKLSNVNVFSSIHSQK